MEIRLLNKSDAALLARYFAINKHHFLPWEPIRESGYYSEQSLSERLTDYEQQHASGSAAHFVGIDCDQVIAHCFLTNIIYGPLRACFMGYGVSKSHEGSGAMTKVCSEAINHAFAVLELNRVIANYMPCNKRSSGLLKKLGFVEEGLARRYLKINGRWEDHVLTALLNPESP